jgi:hypothetical protein
MDIVAHGLWAGAIGGALGRKFGVSRGTLWAMIGLAAAPDIVPMLPVVAYAFAEPNSLKLVLAYATATPGLEPALPSWVSQWTHHLHCTMHSVVVLGALTLLLWLAKCRFPMVLIGWWSHVLIDIPTHSADYYAVPLLYPISDNAFDGVSWREPWMLATNYIALIVVYVWLYRQYRMDAQRSPSIEL